MVETPDRPVAEKAAGPENPDELKDHPRHLASHALR